MSRHILTACIAFAILVGFSTRSPSQERARSTDSILDRRIDVDLRGAHLQEIVDTLRQTYGLDIQLDARALADQGVEIDKSKALDRHKANLAKAAARLRDQLASLNVRLSPRHDLLSKMQDIPYPGVDFVATNIAVRHGLYHALIAFDLTFEMRGESIWITSHTDAEEHLITRVYDVRELARIPVESQPAVLFDPIGKISGAPFYDYDSLIQLVNTVVAPDSWSDVGGPSDISAGQGTLTISQTSRNHELIRAVFTALQELRAEQEKVEPDLTPVRVEVSSVAEEQAAMLRTMMEAVEDFRFQQTELSDVLAHLREELKIPIRVDHRALREEGVDEWIPITYTGDRVEVGVALASMLDSLEPRLAFVIDEGAVVVTSPEVEQSLLKLQLYPVWDLIRHGRSDARRDLWDYDTLVTNIHSNVFPDSWDAVGGPASIAEDPNTGVLAISQMDRAHEEIQRLMSEFRQQAAKQQEDQPAVAIPDDLKYITIVFRLWQPWSEKALVKEDDVVKLLSEMIEPDSWTDEEVFVRTLPSRLIIRQKKSVHQQIYQTLQQLAILKPIGMVTEHDSTTQSGAFGDRYGGGMGGLGGGTFGAAGALPPGGP